jgi:hypothetical protein
VEEIKKNALDPSLLSLWYTVIVLARQGHHSLNAKGHAVFVTVDGREPVRISRPNVTKNCLREN